MKILAAERLFQPDDHVRVRMDSRWLPAVIVSVPEDQGGQYVVRIKYYGKPKFKHRVGLEDIKE